AIFQSRYGNQVQVVRNVPSESKASIAGVAVDLPDGDKIILQGAYIDPDRGGEELVEAMAHIPQVHLLVVGSGRAIPAMRTVAGKNVTFLDRLPHEQLKAITSTCLLGLSLDKPTHDNYKFSLPNKLFDYWQSGIPVLASPMVEVEKLVLKYNAGQILRSWAPKEMANQILEMLHSEDYTSWKKNAVQAAQENTWESEVRVIEQWIVELT
ncbi:MAG: glycosyltransferase family 4 protein, partial [Bacteroidetes bacterium]|nr:glycosyltransferase family 4 protein [Bacteroidota bacterium]